MGKLRRTKAGIILEKILSENKHRYLWCWNGETEEDENSSYDCACCLTWAGGTEDEFLHFCGCVCHIRIEAMASNPHVRLWLVALEAMKELPPFFASYAEKLIYSIGILKQHTEYTTGCRQQSLGKHSIPDCICEYCEFARNDVKVRKFAIEGQDNSHISDAEPAKPVESDGTGTAT